MANEEAFLKKLREAFVMEAQEQLERVSEGLLKLQTANAQSQKSLIENTFRELHNLKGSARAVNLSNLEIVCQSLEDIFSSLKKLDQELSNKLLDDLHGIIDTLIINLKTFETAQAADTADLLLVLEPLSKPEALPNKSEPESKPSSDDANIGSLLDSLIGGEPNKQTPSPGRIDRQNQNVPDAKAAVELGQEAVRISAARLDELLTSAEEMINLKAMTRQHLHEVSNVDFHFDPYSREWSKIYSDVKTARTLIRSDDASPEHLYVGTVLTKIMDFLEWQQTEMSALEVQLSSLRTLMANDFRSATNTVDAFLEDTKKLLLTPASTLLEVVPKLVRDLSKELGKEVDLTVNGSRIQVDKRVLAMVKDPLIHILRNSIDHGIEKREERLAAGKPARASLSITVTQSEGSLIEITIVDDGRGIDPELVKNRAIALNLITEKIAADMTDEEAIALIFQSSFSTSQAVSSISGRGLGMAIARENVTKAGGRLHVESRVNQGTTFKIILPVTVATFRGVLIKCAGELLVVPTSDLERVLRVRKSDIVDQDGVKTVEVDSQKFTVSRLSQILELPEDGHQNTTRFELIMTVRSGETNLALIIDEVLEEQEILVKKFSKPLVRTKNVAGVTLLGSGKPAPILNISDIVKSATSLAKREHKENTKTKSTEAKEVLVVDDTITARILMKNILGSAGFSVKTANDGKEALLAVSKKHFDLVVSDIEMPNMNGIELTAALKKNELYKDIPVILVTSMTDKEYRDKATEAGANAFFVKSSFDPKNLLDVIRQVL